MSNLNRLAPLAALFVGGCELWPYEAGYPYTTTDPVTDFGWATQDLYGMFTWAMIVIMAAVTALMVFTLVSFRDDGSDDLPEQIHGNTQMEIGWTILPIGIVLFLIVPTIQTIFEIGDAAPRGAMDENGDVILDEDGKPAKPSVEIRVTGKRWWWAFEYVNEGIRTGNLMAVPDDRPVSLLISSDTVIHSFWAPRIGGKRDAVPGRMNRIWFNMEEDVAPGEVMHIRGECAEYCGEAHALMRFEVVALDGADFDQWVEEYREGPTFADSSVRTAGETAFTEAGCIGCHQVSGNAQAMGMQGPNLTHFSDRRWVAAGVHDMYTWKPKYDRALANTPGMGIEEMGQTPEAVLALWIANPNELKPGTTKSMNVTRALDGMNIPVDMDGNGILSSDELDPAKLKAIVDYLLAQQSSFPIPRPTN